MASPSEPTTSPATAPPADTRDPSAGAPVRTLIDTFLEAQAATTAAERFAQRHEGETAHVQGSRYRDLMPATPPGTGQQYAFDVDLDACSGCKACVTACHALNGLEEGESWRAVGTLVGTGSLPLVQPVTTSCHHCSDPGCLKGCPVDAYDKDPVTGIVEHLDDQCIGCRYCTLTCPYEVPQYSSELGIVRKCDLCADRLSAGEAPACVQACPTRAISIRVVDVEGYDEVAGSSGGSGTRTDGDRPQRWPFEAPDPRLTRPTTSYRTTRALDREVEAADLHAVRPGRAHLPLTVMLVLTQISVGAYVALQVLRAVDAVPWVVGAAGDLVSLGVAAVALAASVLHVGRPHLAWKAFIGLRHSWLSREIVVFSAFGVLAAGASAVRAAGGPAVAAAWLAAAAALAGAAAVACSVMVYAVTGRRFWRAARIGPRFALTAAGPGVASVVVVMVAAAVGTGSAAPLDAVPVLAGIAAGAMLLAIVWDLRDLLARARGDRDELGRAARLLTGALRPLLLRRAVLGVAAAGMLALVATNAAVPAGPAALVLPSGALLTSAAADMLERWWFFTAESSIRMPGGRP